jgi:uncharacterized glyoxalase superfamily protein PhnB
MAKKPAKIAAIPRGFRAITPHIITADVSHAVALYEAAFDGVVGVTEMIPGTDTLMFAQMRIGNSLITIGRGPALGGGPISLHHYVTDAQATWDKALEAGFSVVNPLSDVYWGDRTGVLYDPLGVRWSIGQRIQRMTPVERKDRARDAMEQAAAARDKADPANSAT